MKATFTCCGTDEDGKKVELELVIEKYTSSVATLEFLTFCKLCQERNLNDISLRYSFDNDQKIYVDYYFPCKEPRKTFLEWIKSFF